MVAIPSAALLPASPGGRHASRRPGRLTVWLSGAVLGVLVCQGESAAGDPRADAVFETIAARLALMQPVAAWKRAHDLAIEDRAREAIVIDNAAEVAAEAGLDADTTRPFFEAQIEAAKAIQTCWLARWDGGASPPSAPPDLRTEIRPRLLEIGSAMISAIDAALSGGVAFDHSRAGDFTAMVDTDCLSPEDRDAIYRALSGVRLAAGQAAGGGP